jgi:serine/threonine-protein kinase RsbW
MDNEGPGSAHRGGLPAVDRLLDELIELRVPADASQIPLVRMLVQAVVVRADHGLDAIADAKMAVDEACAQLVELADLGATMTCRFRVAPEGIHLTVETQSRHTRPPSDRSFGWHVLTTLAHSVRARSVPVPGESLSTLSIDLDLGTG